MEYSDNISSAWEPSEYDYDDNIAAPTYTMALAVVLQGLATAVGLLANSFLLVLFATSPRQRTVSNMYLLQRAVGHVLSLSVTVFFIVFNLSNMKYSPAMCRTLSVVLHVGVVAALEFFILFTMDSYLASRPQDHTLAYRRKMMRLTSMAAWLLAAAVGLVAFFVTHIKYGEICNTMPLFGISNQAYHKIMEMCVLLIVPLVVVWVFISVTLPPSPALPKEGHEGPNRRLLLCLAATFTVLNGVFWLFTLLGFVVHWRLPFIIMSIIAYSLPFYCNAIDPILVICLSNGLRQTVAGWLPGRHSASLPLQDLGVPARA